LGLGAGTSTYIYVSGDPLGGSDFAGLMEDPVEPERAAELESTAETRDLMRRLEENDRERARESRLQAEMGGISLRIPASQRGMFGTCAKDGVDMQVSAVGPVGGNGGSPEFLTSGEIARIQNAADRIKAEINLVGSRATGTTNPYSDWDYAIEANAPSRNSVARSLPGAGNLNEGIRPNIDVFNEPVKDGYPFVKFTPRTK